MSADIDLIKKHKKQLKQLRMKNSDKKEYNINTTEFDILVESIDKYIKVNLYGKIYEPVKFIFAELYSYLQSVDFKTRSIRAEIYKLETNLIGLFSLEERRMISNLSIINRFKSFASTATRLNEYFYKITNQENQIKKEGSPLNKEIKELQKKVFQKSRKLVISPSESANIWNGWKLLGKKNTKSNYERACKDIVEDYEDVNKKLQEQVALLEQQNKNLIHMLNRPKYSPIKYIPTPPKKNFFGFGNRKTRRRIR